jgi:hypothetical protein
VVGVIDVAGVLELVGVIDVVGVVDFGVVCTGGGGAGCWVSV